MVLDRGRGPRETPRAHGTSGSGPSHGAFTATPESAPTEDAIERQGCSWAVRMRLVRSGGAP